MVARRSVPGRAFIMQGRTLNIEYPRELQLRFEGAIVEGRYAPGERVSVDHLAAEFQAPRDQVRQVLLAAQRKGLVDRIASGSEDVRVLGLPTTAFASVFTHTARAGFKPTSLVREVEVEAATPLVAAKLRVEAGSPVYRYVRTRYVDGQPLANQTNYMPFDVCPGLEHDDVSRYSFQKLLEERYHAVLVEMVENYQLTPATGKDRDVLGLPESAPVLVVDRIALSATDWPLVWATIRIRPDRFDYVAALWPQAATLLEP
jgi:GntR family transcriptional regulator